MAELREGQPFIAVSAERGINLRHLFEMVQPTLSPAPTSNVTSRAASSAELLE